MTAYKVSRTLLHNKKTYEEGDTCEMKSEAAEPLLAVGAISEIEPDAPAPTPEPAPEPAPAKATTPDPGKPKKAAKKK